MAETLTLPGFVNAHSHAFQRALRGRTEGRDFWEWRSSMLSLAEGLSPEQVRLGYVQVYRELVAAGYTAVGEFHYLGLPEAHAAVEAAAEAGIELVLLLAAYGRGGLERFRQESPADYLSQLEDVLHAGLADDRDHRLWLIRRERPQTRALAAGHHDCLHVTLTSLRAFRR